MIIFPAAAALRRLIAHLRLPFQLMLAPIFMLGAFLGGGLPDASLLVAFLAVHVGIYGGMTAFNSYYDQDRGPIGFMKRPSPATRFVRDGGLLVQGIALAALLLRRPAAAAPGAALVAMGVAYSHPRWRWKASLWKSLLAVGLGQGFLAFHIGFLAAGGRLPATWSAPVLLAAIGATLATLGLYPITQVYQIEEDRARGDRSLAVAVGWRLTLVVAAVAFGAGVALVALAVHDRVAPIWMWILALGVPVMWTLLYLWSRRFESQDTYRNHDWAMGLGALTSGAFWALIVSQWVAAGR